MFLDNFEQISNSYQTAEGRIARAEKTSELFQCAIGKKEIKAMRECVSAFPLDHYFDELMIDNGGVFSREQWEEILFTDDGEPVGNWESVVKMLDYVKESIINGLVDVVADTAKVFADEDEEVRAVLGAYAAELAQKEGKKLTRAELITKVRDYYEKMFSPVYR